MAALGLRRVDWRRGRVGAERRGRWGVRLGTRVRLFVLRPRRTLPSRPYGDCRPRASAFGPERASSSDAGRAEARRRCRRSGLHLLLRRALRTARRRRGRGSSPSIRCGTRSCRKALGDSSSGAGSRGVRVRAVRQRAAAQGRRRTGAERCSRRRRVRGAALSVPGAGRDADVRVLDASARMSERPTLGYRDAVAVSDSALAVAGRGCGGTSSTGRSWSRGPGRRRRGDAGARAARRGFVERGVHASYLHTHWASEPGVARRFVERCRTS